MTLDPHIVAAATRQQARLGAISNVQAALDLHDREKHQKEIGEGDRIRKGPVAACCFEASQDVRLASPAGDLSRSSRSSGERRCREGQMDRTPCRPPDRESNPMGHSLRARPGDTSLIGCGRRVSTLRAQVRAARRFLKWWWENHAVRFPTALEQLLEYLQARLSEPCNRGSLRNAHEAMVFLGASSGSRFRAEVHLYEPVHSWVQRASVEGSPGKPFQTGTTHVHQHAGGTGRNGG